MDELIAEIHSLKVSVNLGGTKVSILAFADDLVLLTPNRGDMQCLLDRASKFFDKHGLQINVSKCQSLLAEAVSGKRSHKVSSSAHQWWKGVPMPSLTYDSLAKYLGVEFNPRGEIFMPQVKWKAWMTNIWEALLKLYQRAVVIKGWLIPRLMYQLQVSDIPTTKIKAINREIKHLFKEAVHLPEPTPDCWIHLLEGGVLPNLCDLVLKSRLKATLRMTRSIDPVTKCIGVPKLTALKDVMCESDVGHVSHPQVIAEERVESNRAKLHNLHNGSALRLMTEGAVRKSYLWDGTLRGEKLVHSLKILSGTLPTRVNLNWGNPLGNCMCRRCQKTAETDLHILNECPFNHKAMCCWHDSLVLVLVGNLKCHGFKVWVERSYQISAMRLRPDITAVKGGNLYFLDITVPYEQSNAVFLTRSAQKWGKYWQLTMVPLLGFDGLQAEVVRIVIGSAGTVPGDTLESLKKLRIKMCARTLGAKVLSGSATIWKLHLKH